MLTERQQDSPVINPHHNHGQSTSTDYSCEKSSRVLKKSLSQEETQIYSDKASRSYEKKYFHTNNGYHGLQLEGNFDNKHASPSNANFIQIGIDKLTLKRNTIYDKAKLRVYLEQCRLSKKKAEFDQIIVGEELFRNAIEDIHQNEMAVEYR